MNYLINNLSSFSLDTFIYSPYKEDLVDVANERNSTILRLLEENAELMRRICNLDRNHVYRRKKKLELAKQAPVCTIQVIDVSDEGSNSVVKEGLQQNASSSKTCSWILPGCDFSIVKTEDIIPSDQIELAQQLDLEALISNAVDSLDLVSSSSTKRGFVFFTVSPAFFCFCYFMIWPSFFFINLYFLELGRTS
jgi:hypothetical protein